MKVENLFGIYLKAIRINDGFKTQKQLSEVSRISQTTLSRMEGGVQKPQPETLLLLSKCLKSVTYGELMERAGYLEGLSEEDKELVSEYYEEQQFFGEKNDAQITIRLLEEEALKFGMKSDDPLFLEMLKNAFDLMRLAQGKNPK